MAKHFNMKVYNDWDEVTYPNVKDMIYLIIKGQVCIISDERIQKKAKTEVRRTRKKRQKAEEKRQDDIKRGIIPDPNDPDVIAAKKLLAE